MLKLFWYIAKTILISVLIITVALAGLFVIFTFVAEANHIGQGNYNLWQALLYVILSLPANVYLILPVSGLIGTLMGLGILANNNELVVMLASGISIRQIAIAVFSAATFIMFIAFSLGSYLGPVAQHSASLRKAMDMENQAVLVTAKSTWLKVGNDFVFVGKAYPDGVLKDIVRYHIDKSKLIDIDSAKSAQFAKNSWKLKDITELDFAATNITKKHYDSKTWHHIITPGLLTIMKATPADLTMASLSSYIQYRKDNGLATKNYELQWWKLIFGPISIVILMLLAVPFVFGPLRSSANGLRLLFGVSLGFCYFILNQFFGPFTIVYGISPLLGAAFPTIIFTGLLCWTYLHKRS